MPRIKIQLPQQFSFSTTIPIRITDVNYGGHVGNDSILSLIHEARIQYLKHFGYDEFNFEGAGLIMNDVGIEYKSELFYGDAIKFYIAAGDFTRISFDVFYKIIRGEKETVVAIAKTGMVCFDYTKKKVVAIPETAKKKLAMSNGQ